jgi:hypothetical protein
VRDWFPNSDLAITTLNLSLNATPGTCSQLCCVLSDSVLLHSDLLDSEKCFIAFLNGVMSCLIGFCFIAFSHLGERCKNGVHVVCFKMSIMVCCL